MGNIAADQNKVTIGIIGHMAADLALARAPIYVNQFNFRMVVPDVVFVQPVLIKFLIGIGMPKIRGYGLKCGFLFYHVHFLFPYKGTGSSKPCSLQN
jgi:hypothetical protein